MAAEPRHERSDVNVRGVLMAAAALVAAAVVIHLALGVQLDALQRARARQLPPPPPLASAAPEAPPEPRLQTSPEEDLAEMRAMERAALDGYGWQDRGAGVVRIPIERAIEVVAGEARAR
jgi:hypothetical protein